MDYSAYCSAARGLGKTAEVRSSNKPFAASGLKPQIQESGQSPEKPAAQSPTPQAPPQSPNQSPNQSPKEESKESFLGKPTTTTEVSKNVNPNPFIVHLNKHGEQDVASLKSPEKSPELGLDSPTDTQLGENSDRRSAKVSFAKGVKEFPKAESASSWLPDVPYKPTATEDTRAVTKAITNPRVLAALDRHKGINPVDTQALSKSKRSHNRLRLLAFYLKLRAVFEHRKKEVKQDISDSNESGYEVSDADDEVTPSGNCRLNLAWKEIGERFHRHFSGSKSKLIAWLQQLKLGTNASRGSKKEEPTQQTAEQILEIRKTFDYVPEFFPFAFPRTSNWFDCNLEVQRSISRRCSQLLQTISSEYTPNETNKPAPPYGLKFSSETDSICETLDVTSLMQDLQGLNAFYATDEVDDFFNDWNNVDTANTGKAFLAALVPLQALRRTSRYNPSFVEGFLPVSLTQASGSQKNKLDWGPQANRNDSPDYDVRNDSQSIHSYEDAVDTSSVLMDNSDDEDKVVTRNRNLYYMSSSDDNSFNEWKKPRSYRTNFRPLSLVKSVASFSLLFGWDEEPNSTDEENNNGNIVELNPIETIEEEPSVIIDSPNPLPKLLFKRVNFGKTRFWRSKETR